MIDAPTGKALLYARVSTAMQVEDGVSLDVQERTLRQAGEMYGFTESELVKEEGRSGKNVSGRPKLINALKRLDNKEADALIVTRIDRLARSTKDFLDIVDRANKNNWRLILLDLNLDTSTYQGRFVVTIMSALAEMERGIIAERAKDIHKDRRQRGVVWGRDMGPKQVIQDEVRDQVALKRKLGYSFQAIADGLNSSGIQTPRGGSWYPSSIKNIVDALNLEEQNGDAEES
jgi:DNA invertase Pin-like site-specific DNA recombinase